MDGEVPTPAARMPDRPAVARLGIAVVFVALVGCGSPSSAISPKPAAQEALV